jgi:hypothetical protein
MQGDLIIVPAPIPQRRILVGEFLYGPERRTWAVAPKYGKEPIPGRAVRWFPPINEIELPERVSEVVRRPNPFVSFDLRLYREIFDRTFGTYAFDNQHSARFDTRSQAFTGDDSLDFIVLSEAVANMVAACENPGGLSGFSSLVQLAVSQRAAEYQSNLSININSPGSILTQSLSIVPLVFAALFSLFQTAQADDKIPTATVVNSVERQIADHCAPKVDSAVQTILSTMQIEVWREACERSVRLRNNPQMQGVARALPAPAEQAKGP